jgi:hypothetical protein
MRAIARQGDAVYLIPETDGFAARVLDLEQGLLSAPAPLATLLRDGPWETGSFEVADDAIEGVEVVPTTSAERD